MLTFLWKIGLFTFGDASGRLLFVPVVEVTVKYTEDERLAMASVSVKMSSIWQTCPYVTDCKSQTRQAVVAAREVLQKGVMYAIRAQFSFIPSPCP